MKRVIITLSSQDNAMKELNHTELQITDDEQRAISPTKIENQSAKILTTDGAVTTENVYNSWKTGLEVDSCKDCGCTVSTNNKELEDKKLEVEEIKTKLEDELFERLRIEDEFVTERELLEREVFSLRERIDELEGEATWKIDDLEDNFKILTTKYENAKEEITHLKVMLERTVSENIKLRNDQSASDDRVLDILDELELWKRKAQENAEKGDTSRSILQAEIDMNEKEISELKENLMETCKNNKERSKSPIEIKCDCQKDETAIRDPDSLQDENKIISNEKQLLELSSELNELYREHVSYQEKFLSLQHGLVSKEQELDDIRGEYESQNIEIQNYKERYAELKDVALATSQENSHLKNRLEKKSDEHKELHKKNIVLETEVVWLREALGLIKTD